MIYIHIYINIQHIHIYKDLFYKHRCTLHTNVNPHPLYTTTINSHHNYVKTAFLPCFAASQHNGSNKHFSTKEPMETLSIISSIEFTTQSCFHQEVQGLTSIEAFLGGVSYARQTPPGVVFSSGILGATARGSRFLFLVTNKRWCQWVNFCVKDATITVFELKSWR